LEDVSLKDLKEYYEKGHFPPGSMGPKILAAIRFLESGGKKVIISDVEKGWEAYKGETGTHISTEVPGRFFHDISGNFRKNMFSPI